MIHKQYGKFIMQCDECDDELDPHEQWDDMMAEAKATDWLITKDDDDDDTWIHICKSCVAKFPKLNKH